MPLASAALQLAADAITDLTGPVTAAGPGSVVSTIANSAVAAAQLATDAAETAKIKDANVTAAKLAADAVETAKIKDANVTLAKIVSIADARVLLRALGAGSGPPTEGTAAQVAAILGWTGGDWVEDTVTGSAVQDKASSLTMAGTGQDYEFQGVWVAPNATFNATLQLNNLGTNQRDWRFGNATSGAYVNDHTDIRLGSFSAAGTVVFFGRIIQMTGQLRLVVCDMYQTEGATLIGNRGVALWNVTTEITGLRLHASTGNNIGVNTYLRVRKV